MLFTNKNKLTFSFYFFLFLYIRIYKRKTKMKLILILYFSFSNFYTFILRHNEIRDTNEYKIRYLYVKAKIHDVKN